MRITKDGDSKNFTPFSITVHLESQEEVDKLYSVFAVPAILDSMRVRKMGTLFRGMLEKETEYFNTRNMLDRAYSLLEYNCKDRIL